tara:strand:+ start:2062 stop:2286 length:225 start_codon:yes stop_codon:yes gene_type:complete
MGKRETTIDKLSNMATEGWEEAHYLLDLCVEAMSIMKAYTEMQQSEALDLMGEAWVMDFERYCGGDGDAEKSLD